MALLLFFMSACYRSVRRKAMALVLLLTLCSVGYAQLPSQEPLLARTQSVRPNLSLMFDDSASMLFSCNYARHVGLAIPNSPLTPIESGLFGIGISSTCRNVGAIPSTTTPAGVTRTVLPADDPIYISPINNGLAYDPTKRYIPPFITPTTRAGTATVTIHFPLGANVTGFTPTVGGFTPIAAIAPLERYFDVPPPAEPTATWRLVHIPNASFGFATATLAQLRNLSNYQSIAVSATGFMHRAPAATRYTNVALVNPLNKPAGRTDCVANPTYCTHTEEMQNIANWNLYYRDRLRAFRVGVAEAFVGLPDTFRFNYTTLGNTLYTFPGDVRTTRPIADFTGIPVLRNYTDGLGAFYTWLHANAGNGFNTVAQSGTPLRQAYDRLGQYYLNNTSNAGPWGATPWAAGTELATAHLSCRKSFAILATDGQWNNGSGGLLPVPASVAGTSTDGLTGPAIANSPSGATYQYIPGAAHAWSVGKRDNIGGGAGNNATLADVAMYYWMNDLRSGTNALINNVSDGAIRNGPFWQHLNLTTVAFGANGTLSEAEIGEATRGLRNWPAPAAETPSALDDLAHAAHNAGGDFLAVNDAQTFATRLRDKLLAISSEELSQAGVVGSTQALTAGSLKIEANFVSGKWWGNVTALELSAANASETGVKWRVVQLNTDGSPNGTTTIPTPATREIYTYVGTATAPVPFTHTNLSVNGLIGAAPDLLTSTWTADQTDFIRGVRTREGDNQPFRARDSIMGDIVNSTPVFVKNTTPNRYVNWGNAAQQGTWNTYRSSKAARTNGLILVGANDGMLHAFREQDGREVFAYIPRAVLPKLHRLTEKNYAVNHQYYVDGPLNEVDAYIQTPNASGTKSLRWSNLVLGSTGAGAKAVFAIDVTEENTLRNTDILWEINDSQTNFAGDLGYVTQRIQAGVTKSGNWVAVFGNGVGSTNGRARLMIVNLETGALLKTIDTDTSLANGLGGVRLVRNTNGEIIGAYAGDFLGRMWRFDLSANMSSSWPNNGQLLFTAPPTAPSSGPTTTATPAITAMPAVFGRNDGQPGYMVTFGTGKLLYNADLATPHPVQRVFGIWDSAPFGGTETFRTAQYANLVSVNTNITTSVGDTTGTSFYTVEPSRSYNWANDHGWRLDLTREDGQRQIYPVEPLNGLVMVQTAAPRVTSVNACVNDGLARGYNYFVNPLTGGCRAGKTLDTNRDDQVNSTDSGACAMSTQADGTNTNFCIGDCNPRCPNGDCEQVCVSCVEPPCPSGSVYTSDTSSRSQLVDTGCKPPDPTAGFKRTVRQVFLRK